MPRYIAYISTVVPVFVVADNEDAAYYEIEGHIKSYVSDNFDLDTVIANASVEYVEYDSEVETKTKKETPMNERVIKAGIKYLTTRGYEVIDSKLDNNNLPFDIVCSIDDDVVFVDTHYSIADMPEEQKKTRAEFENGMAEWCIDNINIDIQKLRYDIISMRVIESNDKAILRHHINVFGTDNAI